METRSLNTSILKLLHSSDNDSQLLFCTVFSPAALTAENTLESEIYLVAIETDSGGIQQKRWKKDVGCLSDPLQCILCFKSNSVWWYVTLCDDSQWWSSADLLTCQFSLIYLSHSPRSQTLDRGQNNFSSRSNSVDFFRVFDNTWQPSVNGADSAVTNWLLDGFHLSFMCCLLFVWFPQGWFPKCRLWAWGVDCQTQMFVLYSIFLTFVFNQLFCILFFLIIQPNTTSFCLTPKSKEMWQRRMSNPHISVIKQKVIIALRNAKTIIWS